MKTKILVFCGAGMASIQFILIAVGGDAIWALADAGTWAAHAFLFLLYGISGYVIGAGKDPKKFVTRFMGATGLRFFLSLMFVLLLKFGFAEPFKVHVVQFLILYIVYLIADSWSLMTRKN
jgi:hypothetical protein